MNLTGLFQSLSLSLMFEGYANIFYWRRFPHQRKTLLQAGRFIRGTIGLITAILLHYFEVILK